MNNKIAAFLKDNILGILIFSIFTGIVGNYTYDYFKGEDIITVEVPDISFLQKQEEEKEKIRQEQERNRIEREKFEKEKEEEERVRREREEQEQERTRIERENIENEKAEIERKKVLLEIENRRISNIRQKRDEAVSTWRQLIEIYSKNKSGLFRLKIKNDCYKKIYVAVCYYDLREEWTTQGWWVIDGHKTVSPNIKTTHSVIYTYAYSYDDKYTWGDSSSSGINFFVSSESFTRLDDDNLEGMANVRIVSFKKQNIEPYTLPSKKQYIGSQPYTLTFTCN